MARTAPYMRWLVTSFGIVVLCFLGSTAYGELQAREIGDLAQTLSKNAMPSIQQLALARADLRHLQLLADEYVAAPPDARAPVLEAILNAQRRIHLEVDSYLRLPIFPGEGSRWRETRGALSEVDAAVAMTRAHVDAGDVVRATTSAARVDQACERADAIVFEDIEFNAQQGEAIGRRIGELRARSLRVAFVLDALSVGMTLIVAVLLTRAVGSHTHLLQQHNELLGRRAEELEQFAGRVAHDIHGPIGAAMLGLSTVQRRAGDDPPLQRAVARTLSSLERASRIIDGLLAFARAGARPAPGARAQTKAVIADVLDELRPTAAAKGVDLLSEIVEDCAVRCEPSILEVIVTNLIQNAIKYIGEGPTRRVVVRADVAGDFVRVEVQDTGVGIPPALRGTIFTPFVRGPTHGQEGVGLGLATVQRICDSHGGRVGVSAVGKGSCFWFELPRATADTPAVGTARDTDAPAEQGS